MLMAGMMAQKPTVWFVDDLPSNLDTFCKNHDHEFVIETFSAIEQVLRTALLVEFTLMRSFATCTYFDTVEEAQRAEDKISELIQALKGDARIAGIDNRKHAQGIALMRQLFDRFGKIPPFSVYVYSSKAPFLFERQEWEEVCEYGGRVLERSSDR